MNDDFIKVLDLEIGSTKEKEEFSSNINNKKKYNKYTKKARALVKDSICLYCEKEVSSFCNSHSIPEFCLRNIAENGKVLTLNAFVDVPFIKKEMGVGAAGTFQLICRDCDSKIFAEYENPNNYEAFPTQKLLAQIALKNNLRHIGKRRHEIGMHQIMESEMSLSEGIFDFDDYIKILDMKEFVDDYLYAKKRIEKNDVGYYMFFYKELEYVVPIAFQSTIAVIFDFEGKVINQVYNSSPEYEIKNINVCVFPLDNKSIIMLFIKDGDKRYRNFYKQFGKLDLDNQLSTINFLMFAYSEEIYFSKSIKEEILSHPTMIEIAKSGQNILSTTRDINPYEQIRSRFDLKKRNEIPNLLSVKYKLR